MTKVVHLTSVHPPRDVRIFFKEARSLARAGYEAVVIAPGTVNEIIDNVRIRPLTPAGGRLRRVTVTQLAILRLALQERADIYHFHDPELIAVGMLLRAAGKHVVYDVHEDLPRQILHKPWIAPALRTPIAAFAEFVELLAGYFLSAVVAATPTIGRRFPSRKTVVVQNFPMSEEIGGTLHQDSRRDPCTALYAGIVNEARGAREMIRAVALVQHDRKRLVMAGEFSTPGLHEELQRLPGWAHVDYLGWKERSELRDITSRATMGLVLFHPLPNHVNAQPNKLFEYMAAGLPVVASDFPLWRSIVEPVRCGILVDPQRPDAIADAITWLSEHPADAREMGRRGREAVQQEYQWDVQAGNLLELYARMRGAPKVSDVSLAPHNSRTRTSIAQ